MAAIGALAWTAGLSNWLIIAIGLAALLAGALVTARARGRRASPSRVAARISSPDGDVDPEEMIIQDINSGRIWRLGDVHFLGAAEKRRLAMERPHVWRAYRTRLFPLPPAPVSLSDDDGAPRAASLLHIDPGPAQTADGVGSEPR